MRPVGPGAVRASSIGDLDHVAPPSSDSHDIASHSMSWASDPIATIPGVPAATSTMPSSVASPVLTRPPMSVASDAGERSHDEPSALVQTVASHVKESPTQPRPTATNPCPTGATSWIEPTGRSGSAARIGAPAQSRPSATFGVCPGSGVDGGSTDDDGVGSGWSVGVVLLLGCGTTASSPCVRRSSSAPATSEPRTARVSSAANATSRSGTHAGRWPENGREDRCLSPLGEDRRRECSEEPGVRPQCRDAARALGAVCEMRIDPASLRRRRREVDRLCGGLEDVVVHRHRPASAASRP